MDIDYEIGQTLVVELENEVLIGDFKLISDDGRIIELINVRDFNTGYVYTSSQCLPRPQIKSIKMCKTSDNSRSRRATRQNTNVVPETEESDPPNDNFVNIASNDIDHIQSVIATAIYIFQTDRKYHKALADIKEQSVISLQVEPNQFGRHHITSLLIIGTSLNVYVFDILLLGKVFKELKEILGSQRPKKILFYSNRIADNLKHRHNVELTGIFDIYVAHCLISKEKIPSSIGHCVTKYLNMPENYFQGEDELQKCIYERPLQKSHVDIASKKVVFLYKLYEHMLHDIMLENFYNQCRDFSVAFAGNNDIVQVASDMKPGSVHGTDLIGSSDWAELLEQKLNISSNLESD